MSKDEFLKKLEKSLEILNEQERKDIINEYKDTISEKVKNGQTEEEAVKDFGNLDELVSSILDAYKIDPDYNKESQIDKITMEVEKLIKKGADHLTRMTKDFANKIKENDTEVNLNLAFEIIIKIFCTLFILGILTFPFKFFKNLSFSLANTFFEPFSGLVKVILLVLLIALYFGVAFLIIIAFFKPYFTKDKEEKKEPEENKEAKENKVKNIETKNLNNENKDVKIIQRNGPTVGSVFMTLLKIWVTIFILLPLFFIDVCIILGLIFSIFYWIKGVNLLGLTMLTLGISLLFIWFTIVIFNLTFSKGKVSIIPFFIGSLVTAFGVLFFIDMITNIEYINEIPPKFKLETVTQEYKTDKKIYINYNLNGNITKKVNDKLKDNEFQIKLIYDKDNASIGISNDKNYKFEGYICENNSSLCDEEYNYFSFYHDYHDNYGIAKERYNDFIDNLKENKIYNYSKLDNVDVEVVANTETMKLIEMN